MDKTSWGNKNNNSNKKHTHTATTCNLKIKERQTERKQQAVSGNQRSPSAACRHYLSRTRPYRFLPSPPVPPFIPTCDTSLTPASPRLVPHPAAAPSRTPLASYLNPPIPPSTPPSPSNIIPSSCSTAPMQLRVLLAKVTPQCPRVTSRRHPGLGALG